MEDCSIIFDTIQETYPIYMHKYIIYTSACIKQRGYGETLLLLWREPAFNVTYASSDCSWWNKQKMHTLQWVQFMIKLNKSICSWLNFKYNPSYLLPPRAVCATQARLAYSKESGCKQVPQHLTWTWNGGWFVVSWCRQFYGKGEARATRINWLQIIGFFFYHKKVSFQNFHR